MVQVFPFQLSISAWAAFGTYQPTATLTPTPVGREIIRAMPALDPIEIRRLGASELPAHFDDLAAVLADCVAGGASVSYMAPFTHDQAREAFQAVSYTHLTMPTNR